MLKKIFTKFIVRMFRTFKNIPFCNILYNFLTRRSSTIPCGLVVRIPAFHAGGPGSIPGVGNTFCNRHQICILNRIPILNTLVYNIKHQLEAINFRSLYL